MIEMELVDVRVALPTRQPVVILRERDGLRRVLPIFIGSPEAQAIAFAIERVEVPRPMTHDLLKSVLDELGAQLDRVVVTELRESTFYAELHVTTGRARHAISSRPSDGIALAVRTGSPIFANEDLLAEVEASEGVSFEASDEIDAEDMVRQFREFIDEVEPEDFDS